MSGEGDKMNDMSTGKPRRSLLERADKSIDMGAPIRRITPTSLDDASVPLKPRQPPAQVTASTPAPAPQVQPAEAAPFVERRRARSGDQPQDEAGALRPRQVERRRGMADLPPPVTRTNEGPAKRQFAPIILSGPVQTLDRRRLTEHALIDPDGAQHALGEEFRIIKRQILANAGALPNGQRVLVTSAQPDEGKTFSAINLALSLAAERDRSVLLIDGDFARGDVAKRLGLNPGPGLMDALADPMIDLGRCIIRTDVPNFALLPSGQATARDSEYLGSARMAELLEQLEAGAPERVIVFDSTPLLAASSAGVLASHCGQVLVVVRAEVTREAVLRDAIGLLGQHSAISLLLNRVRFTPEGRRFGSYYGDYYGEGG